MKKQEKTETKQIIEKKKTDRMNSKKVVILTIILLSIFSIAVLVQKTVESYSRIDQEVRISVNTEIKRMTDMDATYLINNQLTHASGKYLLEYACYYLKSFGINVDNMNSLSPKTPVNLYYTALDDNGNMFRTYASADSSPLTLSPDEMKTLFKQSKYEQLDSDGDMCYFLSHKLEHGYVIVSYWIEDFGKTALDAGAPYLARTDGILLWTDNKNNVISSNVNQYVGLKMDQVFKPKKNRNGGLIRSYDKGWGYSERRTVGKKSLLVFLPLKEIAAEAFWETVVPVVIFWIVVLAILRYMRRMSKEKWLIEEDRKSRYITVKSFCFDHEIISHIVSLAIFGCILIGMTIMYVSSLISYSNQNIVAGDNLRGISAAYDIKQQNRAQIEEDIKTEFIGYADIVSWGIMRNKQKVEKHALLSMVNTISMMNDVKVTDGTATIIASTTNEEGYTLGRNDNSINSLCWQIMDGEIDNALYGKGMNKSGGYDVTLLVRRQDAKGVIIIDISIDYVADFMDAWSLEETMLTADMGKATTIALFTAEPDKIYVAGPSANHVDVYNTALNEKMLESGYAGVQRLRGINCYVNTRVNSDHGVIFISALPLKNFPSTGAFGILLQIIFGMLLFVLLLTFGFARVDADGDMVEQNSVAASKYVRDAASLEQMQKKFFDFENVLNEEFRSVIRRMVISNGILLACLLLLDYLLEDRPLLAYLLGSQWSKGINLFSVTMILLVLVGCALSGFIFSKIIMMLFTNMGPHGKTIGQLLKSLSRFILFVVAVIWSLIEVGCNLSALLTGAGIAGAAISLCASSTINDLLAGFFLVFEGAFKIGDWVKVGDFRGQVLEIGMRTTKIASGDCIKILNNATMTNVTVMDYCNSGALVAIEVAYKEDAEKVIKLLKDNQAVFKDAIPEMEDGPFVKGITNLGTNGVTIEMFAFGPQGKIGKIEREIRLQTKKLFDKHGIEIPFNQVTIHQAEEKH